MTRRLLPSLVALVAASTLVAAAGHAASSSATAVSPCSAVSQPTWSPDGTEFAFFATRWPKPAHTSSPGAILHAVCTAKPDGTNVQPVKYTVCTGKKCPEPPTLIAWAPGAILYTSGGSLYRLLPGSKPQKIANPEAVAYVANAAGTRIAAQKFYPGCTGCAAPVTIYNAQSGAVVGTAGGTKYESDSPTLSADGTQVAFVRDASNDSGKTFGIWTATAHGGDLQRLVKVGQSPFWSPMDNTVAYLVPAGNSSALHVIAAGGGKSRTLVAKGVQTIFGWSPDGNSLAIESRGALKVVDASTGKVRTLLKLRFSPNAVWAPASTELLATTTATTKSCPALYRVPADGSPPTKISSCS